MLQENESKKIAGFSIVEMLMAVAIGMIVLAGLVVVFVSQKKAYDVQAQVTEMHQNARATLDIISQDIAGAGYNPTKKITGFVGIPYNANQLRLVSDLDGDEVIDGGPSTDDPEDITYYFAGSVIYRTDRRGNDQIFAENVEAFDFKYYDASGGLITNAGDEDKIRKIRIELTTRTSRPDPKLSGDGYRKRTLISEVIPRNLSLNITVLPIL